MIVFNWPISYKAMLFISISAALENQDSVGDNDAQDWEASNVSYWFEAS